MSYSMIFLLVGVLFGVVAIASNPAPYYGAFGLVVMAGMGCGLILSFGGPLLALVLFLIYLGGMLVVFAFSTALAAEPHPESWVNREVADTSVKYVLGIIIFAMMYVGDWQEGMFVPATDLVYNSTLRVDSGGVGALYGWGGGMLILAGWVLFLTLVVVLELTRGLSRGTLRAV
uniref:NADH-ubiquinone oxidoreductase chain 6 n=1 Tax=Acanthaphritis unoorum TaxID=270607 RepID=A0A1V1FRD6_9TELE|nr:NADH dehydrogenase subunit 6 [Acanthaphritis unoorum]BAX03901.1 NADH dehydrogenase subunit 6 [Acanthaphritis unoorum]BBU26083.1 NADH dehydrogenase subunit 6 [Acanthaphritis unoorum]